MGAVHYSGFAHCDVWSKDYWSKKCFRVYVGAVHEGKFAHCDVWKDSTEVLVLI